MHNECSLCGGSSEVALRTVCGDGKSGDERISPCPKCSVKCLLCEDSGEVVVRPTRVLGATYWDIDLGDERVVPCPLCAKEKLA